MCSSSTANLTNHDFARFQKLVHSHAGIHLAPEKKVMLGSRLATRLRELGLASYREYYDLLVSPAQEHELEICLNLVTTNETYFFREPKHFEFFRDTVLPAFREKSMRLWSAACSSGEEPYTLAFMLAEQFGIHADWEILGSDLSTRVLYKAARAQYPLERAGDIPKTMLRRYCLKGVGDMAGTFLIDKPLRQHLRFAQINLNHTLPEIGTFDVIFLRNVMIYFQMDTKAAVIDRLIDHLRPGGWLFIGHSETLNGVTDRLQPVMPTIYRNQG